MQKHTPSEVIFTWKTQQNEPPKYVSDIYGGITPRGLLNLNLFFDTTSLPSKETFELKEGNTVGERKNRQYAQGNATDIASVDRNIVGSFIVDLDASINIALWMLEKVHLANPQLVKSEEVKTRIKKLWGDQDEK